MKFSQTDAACGKVETDLLQAVQTFDEKRVKELLKLKDIMVNHKHDVPPHNRNVLEVAAALAVQEDKYNIVKLLVDCPKVTISRPFVCFTFTGVFDASYLLPVSWSTMVFQEEVVGFRGLIDVLISSPRFDINSPEVATEFSGYVSNYAQGSSILGLAARAGLIGVVKQLLELPDIDVRAST